MKSKTAVHTDAAVILVSKINTKEKQKRGAGTDIWNILSFYLKFFSSLSKEKSSSTFKKKKKKKNLTRSKYRTGCVPFRETSKIERILWGKIVVSVGWPRADMTRSE